MGKPRQDGIVTRLKGLQDYIGKNGKDRTTTDYGTTARLRREERRHGEIVRKVTTLQRKATLIFIFSLREKKGKRRGRKRTEDGE